MVDRLDQFAEAIGEALTGHVAGDGSIHCDRCNSTVEFRNLMVRDWNQKRGATCPNCGTHIDFAIQKQEVVEIAEAVNLPGEEATCLYCGGVYRDMVLDVRTGALRPTRFCPHCGHAVTESSEIPS